MSGNPDIGLGAILGGAALAMGLLFLNRGGKNKSGGAQKKSFSNKFAIDCEMVGTARNTSILCRVSVVDGDCDVVYDEIVRPTEPVYDYRTWIHGLTEDMINNGRDFTKVQIEVAQIINGRILIGHSLDVDLKVLRLRHPPHLIHDVATYPPFQKYNKGYRPSLKDLAAHILGKVIQQGTHSSVEDAQTCMELYLTEEYRWH